MSRPKTDEGVATWGVFKACGSQVRAVEGGAYALDFGTVLTMGALLGANVTWIAELLAIIESFVMVAWSKPEDS